MPTRADELKDEIDVKLREFLDIGMLEASTDDGCCLMDIDTFLALEHLVLSLDREFERAAKPAPADDFFAETS